jgi:hypothetical protein
VAHQRLAEAAGHRHRLQVVGPEARLLVDEGVHGQQRVGAEQPGVAVARGACHLGRAQVATGTGAVLDHHRLLQHRLHLVGRQPHDHVAGPAGREGQQHPHGPFGPGTLGQRGGAGGGQQGGGQQVAQVMKHVGYPGWWLQDPR